MFTYYGDYRHVVRTQIDVHVLRRLQTRSPYTNWFYFQKMTQCAAKGKSANSVHSMSLISKDKVMLLWHRKLFPCATTSDEWYYILQECNLFFCFFFKSRHVSDNIFFICISKCKCLMFLSNFLADEDDLTDKIDFILCLGGDGTLLYASSLFQVSYGLFKKFCGATGTLCFGLWVTLSMGFKARLDEPLHSPCSCLMIPRVISDHARTRTGDLLYSGLAIPVSHTGWARYGLII